MRERWQFLLVAASKIYSSWPKWHMIAHATKNESKLATKEMISLVDSLKGKMQGMWNCCQYILTQYKHEWQPGASSHKMTCNFCGMGTIHIQMKRQIRISVK